MPPRIRPEIIGVSYKRIGRAKAGGGEVRKRPPALARIFIMRPHGASRVAPRVELGLTLMNMNPPRLPGTPIGASENRNKNGPFGGCVAPTLVRSFNR